VVIRPSIGQSAVRASSVEGESVSAVRTAVVTATGAVAFAAALCGPALADAVSAHLSPVPAAAVGATVYGPFAVPGTAGAPDAGAVAGAVATVEPVPAATADGSTPAAPAVAASFAASGVPVRVLQAYQAAAAATAAADPGCRLDWSLLAAVGHVESGHARGGRLDTTGRTSSPIVGPALDGGPGVRAISDSDGGRLDGDTVWDRAVGPMQFIPGTWARSGADANGDGRADPHQVDDAALAAARYLCAGSADVGTPAGARAAVLRYNASAAYATRVLQLADAYRAGVPVRAGYPAVPAPSVPSSPLAGPVAPAPPPAR
jgi:membrane-bound lytic murein transglycosylase B